jgi:hypothetical protein
MELRRATARYVGPVVCCTLAACGSGDGFVGSGGSVGPLEPNFDSIQANVFDQVCVHCHSGANAPVGLRLDAANSYASLVGVPSAETGVLRVAPGNANNSYIIQKLEGTAGVGERMPAGLPALPQSDINIIRQWIGDGALPVSPSTAPIRVTSLSPEPSSMEDAMPRPIRRLRLRAQRAVRQLGVVRVGARRRGWDARHRRRRCDRAVVGNGAARESTLGRHGSLELAARA